MQGFTKEIYLEKDVWHGYVNDLPLKFKLLITVLNFWALYDLMSGWNIVVSVKLTNLKITAFYIVADHAIRDILYYVPKSFPNSGLAFFATLLNLLLQIKRLVFS